MHLCMMMPAASASCPNLWSVMSARWSSPLTHRGWLGGGNVGAGTSATEGGFRPDIQGLRALAVWLVVLGHSFGWPDGGFVGVDVFFVISGYLISSILIRDVRATGRVRIGHFYRRRARRILPAAGLVIAVTTAASWLMFSAPRFASVRQDAIWSTLFAMNERLIRVGTDYFGVGAPPSPLQHFWSLAVEEQFYVFWPLLLMAIAWASMRTSRARAWALVSAATGVLMVGLGLFAFFRTAWDHTGAYYSLGTRAWELLAGALVAMVAGSLPTWGQIARVSGTSIGLVLIAASAILAGDSTTVPMPAVAPAVVGATLVLAAGHGAPGYRFWPLTNRFAQWSGEISYSLYLWHWPILVFAAVAIPVQGRKDQLVLVAVATAVAALSYELVERPVRASSWLEPKSSRERRPRVPISLAKVIVAATVALAAGSFLGAKGNWVPGADAAWETLADDPAPLPADPAEATTHVKARIDEALEATAWPALLPAWEDLRYSAAPELEDTSCANDWQTTGQHCVYGSTEPTVRAAILGDSTAIAWLPGLQDALASEGWQFDSFGKYGCPAAQLEVRTYAGDPYPNCAEHMDWVIDYLGTTHPDVVLLTSAEGYIGNLPSGATGDDAERSWSDALLTTLQELASRTDHIVVMSAPPSAPSAQQCGEQHLQPTSCVGQISEAWRSTSAAERDAVDRARELGIDVDYVDTAAWFCSDAGACPAFIDGFVVRSDANHISGNYSRYLAPLLGSTLTNR